MAHTFDVLGKNENEYENFILNYIRPEFNKICFNSVRASIIHTLFVSKDLNYCLSVEEIAKKLGKRHSVILYHLEKLEKWKIVKVARKYKHGGIERRSVWGLNDKLPNVVSGVYNYMLTTFYTTKELNELSTFSNFSEVDSLKAEVLSFTVLLIPLDFLVKVFARSDLDSSKVSESFPSISDFTLPTSIVI